MAEDDLPPDAPESPESPDTPNEAAARKARIRHEFETTDASVRSLAARHGIKSENQIRRWINREGWRRDVGSITANLVTRAIALPSKPTKPVVPDDIGPNTRLNRPEPKSKGGKADGRQTLSSATIVPLFGGQGQCAQSGAKLQNQGVDSNAGGAAHSAPPGGADTQQSGAHDAQTNADAHFDAAEEIDRLDVSTARGLADIHAAAIRKHSGAADKLIAVGESIMDNLAILTSKKASMNQRALAMQRLTSVSADKETIASLSRAGAALLQVGVSMQRKVLGMDVVSPPGMEPPAPAPRTSNADLYQHIPAHLLHELRDLAKQRTQIRPNAAAGRPSSIEHEPDMGRGFDPAGDLAEAPLPGEQDGKDGGEPGEG